MTSGIDLAMLSQMLLQSRIGATQQMYPTKPLKRSAEVFCVTFILKQQFASQNLPSSPLSEKSGRGYLHVCIAPPPLCPICALPCFRFTYINNIFIATIVKRKQTDTNLLSRRAFLNRAFDVVLTSDCSDGFLSSLCLTWLDSW